MDDTTLTVRVNTLDGVNASQWTVSLGCVTSFQGIIYYEWMKLRIMLCLMEMCLSIGCLYTLSQMLINSFCFLLDGEDNQTPAKSANIRRTLVRNSLSYKKWPIPITVKYLDYLLTYCKCMLKLDKVVVDHWSLRLL